MVPVKGCEIFDELSSACMINACPHSQAERERQRENEIRAFRDFSLNLSSTPLRPSLGSQAGDDHDDGNYPRGPPKRAEYKTGVGVNLDALRDPSVSNASTPGCEQRPIPESITGSFRVCRTSADCLGRDGYLCGPQWWLQYATTMRGNTPQICFRRVSTYDAPAFFFCILC